MRLQNLLKWTLAFLISVSGYFVRGWYEEVNNSLRETKIDHTSLMVLTNEVRHLVENQTSMIEQLDRIEVSVKRVK